MADEQKENEKVAKETKEDISKDNKEDKESKPEKKETKDKQKNEKKKEDKEPKEKENSSKDKQENKQSKSEKKETKDTKGKEEKPKEKEEKSDDFKYIVRLSNTDVDGDKKLVFGLKSIKGIGSHLATFIADKTDINRDTKIGNLTDKQVEHLQKTIDNVQNTAPKWMLNHRNDMQSGEDVHLVGAAIEMTLRDEINNMKKIRCYKGIRHERGLAVRGQRTRANNRKGLTLGVSKKRVLKK